jgi:hypothetical protein
MSPRDAARVNGELRAMYWVGTALKLLLVLLLCLSLLMPDLEQYAGKGMSWRILVFPIAAGIIPVLWHVTGSRTPYPFLADRLIVLPPLLDELWNTLDSITTDAPWCRRPRPASGAAASAGR